MKYAASADCRAALRGGTKKRSIAVTRGDDERRKDVTSKRSGGKAMPGAGAKAAKRGGKKAGLKLKDLHAKNGRKIRGGTGATESTSLNYGKIKYEY